MKTQKKLISLSQLSKNSVDVMSLYHDAFPEAERRPDYEILTLLETALHIHLDADPVMFTPLHQATLSVYYLKQELAGFAITQNLAKEKVVLIEYIAVQEKIRGQRVGKRMIDHLSTQLYPQHSFIAEVDIPEKAPPGKFEACNERIIIYQKLKFTLLEFPYLTPPLTSIGQKDFTDDMSLYFLAARPIKNCQALLRELYKTVYELDDLEIENAIKLIIQQKADTPKRSV